MHRTHAAYFERAANLRTLRDLWVYNIAYSEDMARAYDFLSEQVAAQDQTRSLPTSPLSEYILGTRRPVQYYCITRQEELRRSGITGSIAIERLKSELVEHADTWILDLPRHFSWSSSESENEGHSQEDPRDDNDSEHNSDSLSDSSAGSTGRQHNDESPFDPPLVIQRLQQVQWDGILSPIYNFVHRLLTDILRILQFIFQTRWCRWIFSAVLYYAVLALVIYLFVLWLWGSTQSTVSSIFGFIFGFIFRPVASVGTFVSDSAKPTWSALSGTLSSAGKCLSDTVLDKASNFTLVSGSISSFMTTMATNVKYIFSSNTTTAGTTYITTNTAPNTAVTDIGEAMKDFFKICALSGISIHPISASISVGLTQVYAAGNIARASQIPLRHELGAAYDSLAVYLDQLYLGIIDFNVEVKATTQLSRFELSLALDQISQIKIETTQLSNELPSTATAWSMPFWYGCFQPSPRSLHQQAWNELDLTFIVQVVSCTAANFMDTFLLNDLNDELTVRLQEHNLKAINSTIHEFTLLIDTMSNEFSRLQTLVDQVLKSSQNVQSSFNHANKLFKLSELQIRDRKAEVEHSSSERAEWGTWKKMRSSKLKHGLDRDDEKELLSLASRTQSLSEIASLEGTASRKFETVKRYLQSGRAKIKQVSVTVKEMGKRYENGMIYGRRMYALMNQDAVQFAEMSRQFIEILAPYVADLEDMTRELDLRSVGIDGVINEAWEECRVLVAKRRKLEIERDIGGFGIRDSDLDGEGGVKGEDVETCVLRILWSKGRLDERKGKAM